MTGITVWDLEQERHASCEHGRLSMVAVRCTTAIQHEENASAALSDVPRVLRFTANTQLYPP